MWAHDFCLHFHISIAHNYSHHYAMAMKMFTFLKHVMGIVIHDYMLQNLNIPFQHGDITRNVIGRSLCPYALFSQARSHLQFDMEPLV